MKIGEVARRAGVSVDSVRLYERRGLLAPAHRTRAGYREFGDDAPTRVADVKVLQSVGLSLDQITAVFTAAAPGRHACGDVEPALAATVERLDVQIARLVALRDAASTTRAACSEGACGSENGCHASSC